MKIVTSNKDKIKEFARFSNGAFEYQEGKDLREVDSDDLEVILYKALEAGTDFVVEDTSLFVADSDVGTNIRWFVENDRMNEILDSKAVWSVLMGHNDGTHIIVYQGAVTGSIVPKRAEGFGFDPYFKPNKSEFTLSELELKGEKDLHSARKKAVNKFLAQDFLVKIPIANIPKWDGKYQNEEGEE